MMTSLGTALPGSPGEALQAWPERSQMGDDVGRERSVAGHPGAGSRWPLRPEGQAMWPAVQVSGSDPAGQPRPRLQTQGGRHLSPAWPARWPLPETGPGPQDAGRGCGVEVAKERHSPESHTASASRKGPRLQSRHSQGPCCTREARSSSLLTSALPRRDRWPVSREGNRGFGD